MISKLIYIDVCALSRPFDDQNFIRLRRRPRVYPWMNAIGNATADVASHNWRIRLETEAINLILSKVREGNLKLLFSSAHKREIDAIPDTFERIELEMILDGLGEPVKGDISKIPARAENLVSSGFGIADAAHVAFAEYCGAQFISCDEKLVKKCLTHKIKVWCGNPVSFCEKEGLK